MFPLNSKNGTTLSMPNNSYVGISLYRPEILIANTRNAVYLYNLTNNQYKCIIGCTNSTQFNDTHNALIDNNGNLILTDSNQLLSFPIYSECPNSKNSIE